MWGGQYHYAVRRASRSAELQKAKSLFQASLAGDMDLIKEMKNAKTGCKVNTELPDNVGGAEGEQEICEKFRQVYSSLYNSASTAREVSDIKVKLKELIKNESIEEVMKITR